MLKSLTSAVVWETDDGYPVLESLISHRLASATPPVLTTDTAPGLYAAFLDHLPPDRRQHYTCSCCRAFVERFGNLVTVADDGGVSTVLWEPDGVPPFFAESVAAVRREVLKAKVGGVFLSALPILGTPSAGGWSHFHGPNVSPYKKAGPLTASQAAAAKAEDYGVLCRSLADFSAEVVAEAVRVLEADALDRSEKTLGVAKWFHALRSSWAGPRKNNLVWRAVATAPPGWAHVRNTMIGTLLEDLAAGKDYETVRRRWADKMHPLQYQRPTSLKAGNIERAEKLVKDLGAETALQRRFATLADVVALWRPREGFTAPAASGSVFGHLRATDRQPVRPLELPAKTMTWEKFARDVLPGVVKIEMRAPSHGSYYGLVTAAHADAKPILQWDTEPRNPVSWYFYHGGSSASEWGLSAGSWTPVSAVFLKPPCWHQPEKFKHHGESVFFALAGAKDGRKASGADTGGGLFPECLKAEYHEIRAAVEAYTQAATIAGHEAGDANGYALDKGGRWDCRLRVTSAGGVSEFTLDRWE